MPSSKPTPLSTPLRRSAELAFDAGNDVALWHLHDRALVGARDAGEAAQRLASSLAKERGAIDAVSDRVRGLALRAQEVEPAVTRLADVFERLGLVALNAGLEGARLGEGAGRPLLLVSDEVRVHARRGAEGARDLSVTLQELATELNRAHAQLGSTRETSNEVAQEAARTAGASAHVEQVLVDMGERLTRATGSEPETARAIAEVGEHARALVAAIAGLGERVPREVLAAALKPAVEPLARILAGDAHGEGAGGRAP